MIIEKPPVLRENCERFVPCGRCVWIPLSHDSVKDIISCVATVDGTFLSLLLCAQSHVGLFLYGLSRIFSAT